MKYFQYVISIKNIVVVSVINFVSIKMYIIPLMEIKLRKRWYRDLKLMIAYAVKLWYNYTNTYTNGNIINNNDKRAHFFKKIYL